MKSLRWRAVAVVAMLFVLAGCMSAQRDDEVYFLREKQNDAPDFLALLEGKLILDEGCLSIQSVDGGARYAAIWPFEFDFSAESGNVEILNGDDQIVARVGNQLRVSGGELPNMSQEEFEQNYLGAFQCSGPYWLVNSDVKVLTP